MDEERREPLANPSLALLLAAKGGAAVSKEDFHRRKTLIPACMAREISLPGRTVHERGQVGSQGRVDESIIRFPWRNVETSGLSRQARMEGPMRAVLPTCCTLLFLAGGFS